MNLQNSFQNYNDGVEQSKTTYSGLLGLAIDGSQKVNIPTRAGYVYVRLRDSQSEVIQAFNDKVSPVYDFPVLIQRTGNRWTIVGKDEQRYETFGTPAPYLPQHGDQHSFNRDGGGGGDTVWVYPDQFTPLLVYPSGTVGSGNLIVAPYALQRISDFVYVGNTGTRNLLVYKPTDAQAIVGLVYIDKTSGNPGVLIASGTPMPGTATGTASVLPYLPFPSSNQEPLYAFRLVSGTTSLTWNNLYNVRQFIGGNTSTSTGSSGGGGISGLVFQDEGITQGTGTVVNFVGDNISVSVSGTVARVFVTGSAGGGSLPSFVTGSIPYAGANGSLKEANPDFRYEEDSETLWLGKRPNTGISTLSEYRFFAVATGTNSSVAYGGIAFGTGTLGSPSTTYNGFKSRGTLEAPTAIKKDDAIETIQAIGYSGEWKSGARLRFYADGDWVTGTYASSRAEIDIIPSGSYTRRTQFTVHGDSIDIPSGSSYNIGGVPHTHGSSGGREVLSAARTYYVRTDGNDSNTGLANTAGDAFLTIQKAIDVVATLDLSIYNIIIQVADGTYTGANTLNGTFVGKGTVTIKGNTVTPANVIISTTSASCFTVAGKNTIYLEAIKLQTTTSGYCLFANGQSTIYGSNLNFGACANFHMLSSAGSIIQMLTGYTISGGAQRHWHASTNASILAFLITITLTGTPNFTQQFATATVLGALAVYTNTFSGSATGKRYDATANGAIYTNGGGATYLPGNTAGTTATGGQYV